MLYKFVNSYDGRIKGPAAHWADDVLGGRARWHSATPSSLRMHNVLPTDRAVYRCRVDFKISPTRNHKILLDVIGKLYFIVIINESRGIDPFFYFGQVLSFFVSRVLTSLEKCYA